MSGIKDAKKKRARRRRKRQIQRILLIIAMILILIGFLFLIRAAVHAVVNKFTGPTVTTSADKTAASPKSKKTTADSKWKSFFCPHRFFSANLQKLHGFENGIAVLVEKG